MHHPCPQAAIDRVVQYLSLPAKSITTTKDIIQVAKICERGHAHKIEVTEGMHFDRGCIACRPSLPQSRCRRSSLRSPSSCSQAPRRRFRSCGTSSLRLRPFILLSEKISLLQDILPAFKASTQAHYCPSSRPPRRRSRSCRTSSSMATAQTHRLRWYCCKEEGHIHPNLPHHNLNL